MIHQAQGLLNVWSWLFYFKSETHSCHWMALSRRWFLVSPAGFLSLELSNRSPQVTLRKTSAALKAVWELFEAGLEFGDPGAQGGGGVLVEAGVQLLLTCHGTDQEARWRHRRVNLEKGNLNDDCFTLQLYSYSTQVIRCTGNYFLCYLQSESSLWFLGCCWLRWAYASALLAAKYCLFLSLRYSSG